MFKWLKIKKAQPEITLQSDDCFPVTIEDREPLPAGMPYWREEASILILRCTAGEHKGKTFEIDPSEETAVGRLPDCTISFSNSYISRQHAFFSYHRDEWWIRCKGRAGLAVNDRFIPPNSAPCPLKNNDVLTLAGTEKFVVQLDEKRK